MFTPNLQQIHYEKAIEEEEEKRDKDEKFKLMAKSELMKF